MSGLSESVLLSCLDNFRSCTPRFPRWKSMVGMVVIPSSSFSSHCPCWTSASGSWMLRWWLAAANHCDVLRIVLRLVSVAVLWFALPAVGCALLLPAVGYDLVLPAVGFDFSVHFIIAPDLRCSSRCPRCLVALLRSSFSPQARWFRLGFSPLAPWLWFRRCFFSQSHFVVGYDSVARFWLPANITTQHCALRD